MEKMIGIIADDLTGANDSGVQLTEKGIPTSVLFDLSDRSHTLDSGLVIDTNARALIREKAAQQTKKAALFLKEAGYQTIYKKMDSTLRGHIGTELKAVKDVFTPDFVFIAPAFPALHRTTKDGIHYIKGQPLSETEISKDPKHPVTESSIPRLIEQEIGEKVGLLKKDDLEDEQLFSEKVLSLKKDGFDYLVCDAETEEDLRLFAGRMNRLSSSIIWAGSAGLAEVLPDVLNFYQKPAERELTPADQVVAVCGSLSGVTQEQVRYAAEQEDVIGVEVNTLDIFSDQWDATRVLYMKQCEEIIKSKLHLALYVPSHTEIREKIKERGQQLGLSSYEIGETISTALGEIVRDLAARSPQLKSFVLTGGDTAKETAKLLGGSGIRLIKQIEAGIPAGELIGPKRTMTIVTKAGAFGDKQSIYRAMCKLKGAAIHE
ncbi:four-carbon acid sugar kinase family protein [Jeotgalibacillus sp. ET6]|uniref:four-carbon acid sugar kinase family protein n=1 Tax=Jeotgalibacillus sp. ET6 TaxID=3037260 RepID=UPI002418833E|nr:four-carbon acid sugar kinase family protein [Jeotgalibacillus sp. ET6]MDG5472486.1 four-carbon acid sugar kinase family protein [Jeotgalibacillus sp. ET6]